MDIEGLRTFLAVYRSGGVTRAAAALYRSQPAVSRRLAVLEKDLGVPLFERVPGGAVLSDAGRALLPFAESALAALADAEAAVASVRDDNAGPIAIALVGTLAGSGLTAVLRRFAQRYPRAELTVCTANSQGVSDLVRRAEVTLGLRYARDSATELEYETLFHERLVVAAAPDHALAGERIDGLPELAGQRWIAFPPVPGEPEVSAVQIGRTLEAAGVEQGQILRIDSLTAQKRMVEAGFGIALLPDSGIREEQAAGSLTVLDVEGLDLTMPVTLVTRRNGYLSAAALALRADLRSAV